MEVWDRLIVDPKDWKSCVELLAEGEQGVAGVGVAENEGELGILGQEGEQMAFEIG